MASERGSIDRSIPRPAGCAAEPGRDSDVDPAATASSAVSGPANGKEAPTNNRDRAEDDSADLPIQQSDSMREIEAFLDLALKELSALRTRSEEDALNRATDLILEREAEGGRVHVTGVGKSEYVARYIASLLSSTGTPGYFLHATECVHGSAGQLCRSDVAIAISPASRSSDPHWNRVPLGEYLTPRAAVHLSPQKNGALIFSTGSRILKG